MRLVPPRACESRVCCSSGPGAGGRGGGGGGSGGGGGGGGPAGESTASASDVPRPDEGGTKPGLRSTACLGCVVTSRGGRDGLNLLGGVGVAVVMGVGGAEVGVGGSDSDERKQTPVLAEEDQEGSCFAGLSGFSALCSNNGGVKRTGHISKRINAVTRQRQHPHTELKCAGSICAKRQRCSTTPRLQPCDPKNLLSVTPPPGRSASVSASAGCRRAQRRRGTRR